MASLFAEIMPYVVGAAGMRTLVEMINAHSRYPGPRKRRQRGWPGHLRLPNDWWEGWFEGDPEAPAQPVKPGNPSKRPRDPNPSPPPDPKRPGKATNPDLAMKQWLALKLLEEEKKRPRLRKKSGGMVYVKYKRRGIGIQAPRKVWVVRSKRQKNRKSMSFHY